MLNVLRCDTWRRRAYLPFPVRTWPNSAWCERTHLDCAIADRVSHPAGRRPACMTLIRSVLKTCIVVGFGMPSR